MICVAPIFAQKNNGKRSKQVRINAQQPTVYLKFKEISETRTETEYRLELHNNTNWAIEYTLIPEKTKTNDLPVLYQVEYDRNLVDRNLGDVFITTTLKAGQSVSFLVASKYFSKGHSIYVPYHYDWESANNRYCCNWEPEHRVYFWHSRLPAGLRK